MRSSGTVAEILAAYIHRLDYRQLPSEVVQRSKALLLDQLACQLLGSSLEWNQAIYRFVRENKPVGPATIVNHGDQVPVDDAALVNGTFGQGCELDDYYDQGGGHPGAASVPVAMALAQKTPVSGKGFITALAAGYEIGWRVGRGLLPQMMRRGYHSQGVVGVFIAAATAGKILQLEPRQMSHALAIAGSHASGTMEFDQSGGEVKRMHNGIACSGGIRSAMVAQMGLTGPPTIFEGERGILRVFGGDGDIKLVIGALGGDFAVLHAGIKRFPVNASQHSPIELLDKLIMENDIQPKEVTKIEVGVNEGVILHGGTIYEPKEVIEAQFSMRFSLALRLLKRSNEMRFYLDPKAWRDPEVLEVGKKIELSSDPTAVRERRFACSMRITLRGGKIIGGALAWPKGSSSNPLSQEEMRNKFFSLGSTVLPAVKLNQIFEIVERLETQEDVTSLVPLLTRDASGC